MRSTPWQCGGGGLLLRHRLRRLAASLRTWRNRLVCNGPPPFDSTYHLLQTARVPRHARTASRRSRAAHEPTSTRSRPATARFDIRTDRDAVESLTQRPHRSGRTDPPSPRDSSPAEPRCRSEASPRVVSHATAFASRVLDPEMQLRSSFCCNACGSRVSQRLALPHTALALTS